MSAKFNHGGIYNYAMAALYTDDAQDHSSVERHILPTYLRRCLHITHMVPLMFRKYQEDAFFGSPKALEKQIAGLVCDEQNWREARVH